MKTLLYDIETAPNISAIWGKYEQNAIWNERDWYILSFAYKWLGKKKTYVVSLPMFSSYKKSKEDDFMVLKTLHELMSEADVVIAHNGNKFDNKKVNARFLFHNMAPPTPYKSVDTLIEARRYFKFNSNKLNDLGEYLKVGNKVETGGYQLWKKCMLGDKKSWKLMEKYNKQDVVLLEKVYLKLRPWMTNHPNINNYDAIECCPNCGSRDFVKQGFRFTKTQKYQQYQCKVCGSWFSERKSIKSNVIYK